MQNDTNRARSSSENRFQRRITHETPPTSDSTQAVRQGKTDVITGRQSDAPSQAARVNPSSQERRRVPDQKLNPVKPPEQLQEQREQIRTDRQRQKPPVGSERSPSGTQDIPQRRRPSDTVSPSVRTEKASERHNERPEQVVVGIPKSEKSGVHKPLPVIIDSPDINAPKKKSGKDQNSSDSIASDPKDERKFYFQRPRDISTLRKMLIVVFGFLFLWCIAPAFFHIRGIGVFSSSIVMLSICLTAMFWHLIDRNWTFKKAVAVLFAAAVFTACVAAFGIVSGMMLRASLTAVPNDCQNYTVVVLGCKAHGDQPSWMLHDRLEKAYSLLSENPNVKCVVTGGMGDDEQYTESYVMRKYLVEKGISPDRIYMEDLASSTEENLLYTKSLIRLNGLSDNIVIVTDRFHELRARIWAEKAGFKNIYSGCCETRIYLVTGYWFREMFGLARLYVFGK